MTVNIHATCVEIDKKGVLLLGKSGSGKSDMALRLIELNQAKLVADDRVDLELSGNRLIASCPDNIKGLLEVRGIGIVKYPFIKKTIIKIAVSLTNNKTERLPEIQNYVFEDHKIPMIILNPKEASSTAKLLAALRMLL